VARQEDEKNKRKYIAVVESQAHALEMQVQAARRETNKWQARCQRRWLLQREAAMWNCGNC